MVKYKRQENKDVVLDLPFPAHECWKIGATHCGSAGRKDENEDKVKQENASSESDEESKKDQPKETKKEKVETLDLDDDESDEDIPLATFQKNLVPPVGKLA